jgi:hypothetical protein
MSASMAHNESAHQTNQVPTNKTPLFFREEHSGFIAKGNFMTLAMKPQLVEEGEWLAHQSTKGPKSRFEARLITLSVSEQYRMLGGMLKVVQEMDPTKGRPICNEHSCPTMSAGT